MLTVFSSFGGVTPVTVVSFTSFKFVAGFPSKYTEERPFRFLPLRVNLVPPLTGPFEGVIEISIGDKETSGFEFLA